LLLAVSAAVIGLGAGVALALYLGRMGRDGPGFLAYALSPAIAALAYCLVSAVPSAPAATAAAPAESPAAAPVHAAAAAAPKSVAPSPEATTQVGAWRTEATNLRAAKKFAEARDLYTRIVAAVPNDADAWADLADATAAAAGGDLNAAATAIDHALRVDANHPKALWLKASLELQDKRYASAADLWQRLLAQLPGDSNDARIVSANLEEARGLAARAGASQ
jgi:cytochrome c-type biogenesis protein CcmH